MALNEQRRAAGRQITDEIPGDRFTYTDPARGGGLRWFIEKLDIRARKRLNYAMVEIALQGTAEFVKAYDVPRVRACSILLYDRQSGLVGLGEISKATATVVAR